MAHVELNCEPNIQAFLFRKPKIRENIPAISKFILCIHTIFGASSLVIPSPEY